MKISNRSHNKSSFQCSHCQLYVSSDPYIAGVQNRNHCPYCLWSRHVDLNVAGDRLSACKANMQPIGLTLKRTRKKYGSAQYGELMLIHRCVGCESVVINRIAADDDAALIFEIYTNSFQMDINLRNELATSSIQVLGPLEENIVRTQLFGRPQVLKRRMIYGTYALVLHLEKDRTIRVGALGDLEFSPGYYVYVGSAFGPGGLHARLNHHLLPARRCHWHIDYLSQQIDIKEIWFSCDPDRREHMWALCIGQIPGVTISFSRFGASDCNCPGHLFQSNSMPSFAHFRDILLARYPEHKPVKRLQPGNDSS